jgi:transposase
MVERCFAWCEKFKRLVIRYERQSRLYLSLWHLACTMILLSKLSG